MVAWNDQSRDFGALDEVTRAAYAWGWHIACAYGARGVSRQCHRLGDPGTFDVCLYHAQSRLYDVFLMTFTAYIRPGSAIYNRWREERRLGGQLAGIMFRWVPGNNYISDDLTADQVQSAMTHPAIQVETIGALREDGSVEVSHYDPAADVVAEPEVHQETHGSSVNHATRRPARHER